MNGYLQRLLSTVLPRLVESSRQQRVAQAEHESAQALCRVERTLAELQAVCSHPKCDRR